MNISKYAPRTPAQSLAQSKAEKLNKEKEKATRLLFRLRWKAELLMVSYYRTMEIVQAELQNNSYHEKHHSMQSGATSKQAESMFKVDFFEWYTLLERYITDCLAVFGFSVSASASHNNVNALRYITNPERYARPLASHAFHANLLEALDDETCPLHASLGVQEVRVQLGLAKDYRNVWKGADEKAALSPRAADDEYRRKDIPLQDLQLELMLRAIVLGCEQAHGLVQAHSTTVDSNNLTSLDFQPQTFGTTSMEADDQPFEYMDDAMELD
ncbi:hypothetical protein J1614_011579 [Plenodomus biglobosus]|nr:hypothetical protein J1614_011579 [Plenodomus biglobosus]